MTALEPRLLCFKNPALGQMLGSFIFFDLPDFMLKIVFGTVGLLLTLRIIYLIIHDTFFRNPRYANVTYSEIINQKLRTLPNYSNMSVLHIGDGFCDLLGAENVTSVVIDRENRKSYDIVVIEEPCLGITLKTAIRLVKEQGYFVIVDFPDRQGKTKILSMDRVNNYYQRQ